MVMLPLKLYSPAIPAPLCTNWAPLYFFLCSFLRLRPTRRNEQYRGIVQYCLKCCAHQEGTHIPPISYSDFEIPGYAISEMTQNSYCALIYRCLGETFTGISHRCSNLVMIDTSVQQGRGGCCQVVT